MIPTLKFDHDDAQRASDEWGCNCGPSALAAILGRRLDEVREACEAVQFTERGYMSPTMMRMAIAKLGAKIVFARVKPGLQWESGNTFAKHGLVRIQWGGPWIIDGKAARWASCQTHWIATCWSDNELSVFDINGGLMHYDHWLAEVVPAIIKSIKRADGKWYAANSWEIE